MNEIIKIRNVSFSYKSFSLKDISFQINEGKILGLIGKNGSGKTTLFKIILGYLEPFSGKISFWDSGNILDKDKLGVILDRNHLNEFLTIDDIENIFSKIYLSWNSKVYFSYINKFNLSRNKKIGDFSQGMKVKLNFAITFAHEPKLLLLDEATNGLDPIVRNEILSIIRQYVDEKKCAALISSHILGDLEKTIDDFVYMDEGRVTLYGRLNQGESLEKRLRIEFEEGG